MARPSNYNPLSYFVARQTDDKVDYCKRLVNARFESSENLFRKDLLSHYGCVNAIEFSNQGDLLVSGKKLTNMFNLFRSYTAYARRFRKLKFDGKSEPFDIFK